MHTVVSTRLALCLLLALTLHACSGAPATPFAPGLLLESDLAPDVWTFIPIDGAVCANGKPTGFAMNRAEASDSLMIFFAGGGACRNAWECYRLRTATYIKNGYDKETFETQRTERESLEEKWLITHRTAQANPFAAMQMAYIPYCTGDLHAGNNILTYEGAKVTTHHVGARNVELFMQHLADALPNLREVWLVGVSAGGFATILNYQRAQSMFVAAQVNLIDDSGIAFDGVPSPPSWKIRLPEECLACRDNVAALLAYHSVKNAGSSFGLLAYTTDYVLPAYFKTPPADFTDSLNRFSDDLPKAGNLHTFLVDSVGHIVLKRADREVGGTTLPAFIAQMVHHDPGWRSVRDE